MFQKFSTYLRQVRIVIDSAITILQRVGRVLMELERQFTGFAA